MPKPRRSKGVLPMRTEPSPELAELRSGVRRFVEERLEPVAQEIDRTGAVPEAAWSLMREQGWLGMLLPPEAGGGGVDLLTYCLIMEEVARSHRCFTLLLDATSGLTPMGILRHGTEAQKARWLKGLADGTLRAAFGLTEPEAGSDAAAIRTRAERVPGGWRINGQKHWISGGQAADVVMVMAVTDPEKRARGGIGAFLVERGTPGFEVTRVDTTIGSEAIKLGELTFTDCVVPEEALLGGPGEGFAIAMGSLTSGRLGVSAACIGAADRLNAMSVEHAQQRSTFGQKLAERQAIQWMLADSATEIEVARAFLYDTLRRVVSGSDPGSAASMAKLFCSEMVGWVADRAVQVHGGIGLVRGFPVERFYRDIRHYRVGEGTSEIQRMLIARDLLR
jgi:acyl-CoA dehydrogenase